MDLHELSPVGRCAAGEGDGRWFERFAEMCEGLTLRGRSHPGLPPLANLRFEVSRLLPAVSSASDVATTPRALQRKRLAQPSLEFGSGFCARCRGRAACRMGRSGRRWYLRRHHVRRQHADQPRHRVAYRHSVLSRVVVARACPTPRGAPDSCASSRAIIGRAARDVCMPSTRR